MCNVNKLSVNRHDRALVIPAETGMTAGLLKGAARRRGFR